MLFKFFACRNIDSLQAIAFNYLTATLLGFSMSLSASGSGFVLGVSELALSVVMGVMFMLAFVLMARSTASSGVAVTTVAARVSLIIPVVLSYLLLPNEAEPRWWAIVIIILALVMVIMRPSKSGGRRRGVAGLMLPFGVFLLFGANNFCLKWAQSGLSEQGGAEQLSALIFLFASIASWGYFLTKRHRNKLSWKALLGGVGLGVANYFTTYFMVLGLAVMPSGLFFPIYHVGIVALVTALGMALYGERLSKVQIVGMAVAAIGIVVFFV